MEATITLMPWRKDTEQFTGAKENNWEAKQATLKKKKSEYANKGHLKQLVYPYVVTLYLTCNLSSVIS